MTLLLTVLGVLAAGGILGTVQAVRSDGYRSVADRADQRPVERRPFA